MFYVLCTGVHSMLSRDGLSAGAGFGRLRFSLRGGCCCSPFPLSKRSVNHGHGACAPSFVSVEFVSFGIGANPRFEAKFELHLQIPRPLWREMVEMGRLCVNLRLREGLVPFLKRPKRESGIRRPWSS